MAAQYSASNGAAHQNHLHTVLLNCVIGQLCVTLSGPVTQCVAGTRTYYKVLAVISQLLARKLMV